MRIRNPFLLLASEHIDYESTFLGLFEPGILDIFQKRADSIWNRVFVIRSSPGGGKTTLLRLFTPSSLKNIYNFREGNHREIYERLKDLDVLNENGIHTMGIMLSCSRDKSYAGIEDLDIDIDERIDTAKKIRLLFSLLNSRIIISALKGLAVLLSSPLEELDSVYIRTPEENVPSCYPTECRGSKLFEWAQYMEERICSAVDDLTFSEADGVLTDSAFSSLYIINPKNLLIDNSPIVNRVVVMLDDFHQLTPIQRDCIMKKLRFSRPPLGFWISERLEALSEEELISSVLHEEDETYWGLEKPRDVNFEVREQLPGDQVGRDFDIIVLEDFWRKKPEKFEKMVSNVASKRIGYADFRGVNSFEECLVDTPDEDQWQQVLTDISKRIEEKISKIRKFEKWLEFCKSIPGSNSEKTILLRALEILMERDRQTTLDDFSETEDMESYEFTVETFQKKCGSNEKAAAELFITRDFNLPYYFGWSRIARISSFNIEEFIHLCSYLFEELLSSTLLNTSHKPLAPRKQEKILERGIDDLLNDKIEKVQNKETIMRFIGAIGEYSNWETYRHTAPYSPGVTGIGMRMSDMYFLIDHKKRNDSIYRKYKDLILSISECIKKNLLMPIPNYKCKGKIWMVLYLNRMLCLKYDLPLQYGGWREKTLTELNAWSKNGLTEQMKRRLK